MEKQGVRAGQLIGEVSGRAVSLSKGYVLGVNEGLGVALREKRRMADISDLDSAFVDRLREECTAIIVGSKGALSFLERYGALPTDPGTIAAIDRGRPIFLGLYGAEIIACEDVPVLCSGAQVAFKIEVVKVELKEGEGITFGSYYNQDASALYRLLVRSKALDADASLR